ncbi:uncharacterized protein TM35_000411870 [Trypanosoma theileri]|uniref:Uncharacterized protein n=1 Tax=Trypanosoma theileri TaxID=67003 RepID=A0A1X0NJK1_9TRYP|nr:uncharacterized protein TM35_000411870 [Trypanosoma theileri]ORC84817.1 hypothetical protein TM35_000411870 [Trypanosoma theileri]
MSFPSMSKKTRSYSLQSRQYIDRVILAQRSQQFIALMWLLAESMRHAWRLHLRLAQLYVYYVPSYLQAMNIHSDNSNNSNSNIEEVLSITKNKYYAYFCSGNFDYEYYVYQFNEKWDALFAAVHHYMDADNINTQTTTTTTTTTTNSSQTTMSMNTNNNNNNDNNNGKNRKERRSGGGKNCSEMKRCL